MARLHCTSGFIDIFFLAGSTLLLMLIVLSGSSENPSFPLNRFYWVEASTSNITGAYAKSRWTYWGVCEVVGDSTKNCHDSGPAIPISPVDNFDTESGFDNYFVDNRDTFYYLSRVGWCTLLISLVFTAISLITSAFSIVSFHVQKITALFVFIGCILQFAAAALYTATVALFKQHYSGSKIGPTLMGLVWASAVCNLIVLVTTFGSCARESYLRAKERHLANESSVYTEEPKKSLSSAHPPVIPAIIPVNDHAQNFEDPYAISDTTHDQATKSGGINFFKVKRNRKPDEESDL